MNQSIDLVTIFIAFIALLLILIQYLAFCMELKSCLSYFGIDSKFAFVPVYNSYLYLQLGDDFEDGMLTITERDRIPRKFLFVTYCVFVGILVLFTILQLPSEPFLFPLLIVLFAMNLSVAGATYGVYFYEGFTLDDSTLVVIASSALGSLPFVYVGRYLVLHKLLKVCENESNSCEN